MMGRGHALSGAALWLVAAPPTAEALGAPLAAPAMLAGGVVAAGAGLLPDADHSGSRAARSLGPVTQLLALLIHAAAGGHREATHSAVFCAAIAGVVTGAVAVGGRPAALLVAGVCTGLALRALGPQSLQGGRLVDVGFLGATLVLTGVGDQLVAVTGWLPAAVTVGVATHLLGDFLAGEGGIPLFWPHPTRYAIPVLGTVGGLREHAATLALAGLVVLSASTVVGG